MEIQYTTVRTDSLIFDDDRFFTYAISPDAGSLKGGYPPPALARREDLLIPVTGHGRILFFQSNGTSVFNAAIFSGLSEEDALAESALYLSRFRDLNHADIATAVGKFRHIYPEKPFGADLARALAIEPSARIFEQYERISQLGDDALSALRSGWIEFGCALAVVSAPGGDRAALTDLFINKIKPNRNTANRIVDNILAICIRDGISINGLLESEQPASILDSKASGPEKIIRLDDVLRRARYPELCKQEDAAKSVVAELTAKSNVAVSLPYNLEGKQVRFEISAQSTGQLKENLDFLCRKCEQGKTERVFEFLK